jgi:hypothetical protein
MKTLSVTGEELSPPEYVIFIPFTVKVPPERFAHSGVDPTKQEKTPDESEAQS